LESSLSKEFLRRDSEAGKLTEALAASEKKKAAAEEEVAKLKSSLDQLSTLKEEIDTLRKSHENLNALAGEMEEKAKIAADEKQALENTVAELRASLGAEKGKADSLSLELQEGARSGEVIAELYAQVVSGFGGQVSPLPPGSSLGATLKWI
jgi:predicted  nucleic acid-binding Zn-ribbon protein